MALRDVGNFQFLRDAIIYRYRDRNLQSLKGIPYEPVTDRFSIFGRIYNTFRELIPKGLNLHQYLNISDRSVLENLYRNLQSDINLKFLNDPKSVLNDARFKLSDQYYQEKPLGAVSQQTTAGQASSAPPMGTPVPGGTPPVKSPSHLPPQTIPQVTKEEAMEETKAPKKEQQNSQAKASTPTTSSPSGKFNPPAFRSRVSSLVKSAQNFTSPAGPVMKTNLNRVGEGLKNMFGQTANLGGRAGLNAINHGGNFFSNLSSSRARLTGNLKRMGSRASSFGEKRWALVGFGLFFTIALLGALLGSLGNSSTGEAAILPPGTTPGTTDISVCSFSRAGSGAKFQSPLLLSYIQEASQKSSIPAVVLAAFIRVESPSSSGMSDDQITNYSANCAESSTGALGLMQIQPPGTTSAAGDPASCDDCIDAGAKLVGKSVTTMTRADYCDPRTNIIVGAGWILRKMNKLGYGDGTSWDPLWTNNTEAIKALVKTYYGCLDYGTTECSGPYNYATDVSTSIQNCQISGPPYQPGKGSGSISCPLNSGAKTVEGSKGVGTDGGHCGLAYITAVGTDQGCIPGRGDYTGKDTAIDVTSSDGMVYWPNAQGVSTWTIDEVRTAIGDDFGGGTAVAATTKTGSGITYQIRLVHMGSIALTKGQTVNAGAPIGQYYQGNPNGPHVHITIRENNIYKPADNLCQ